MVQTIKTLGECFPGGYVNFDQEFVAHRRAGAVCDMKGCTSPLELRCRVIEQLVGHCCKTRPFKGAEANVSFRRFMMEGMGRFLGVKLVESEYELVYERLGNGIDRQLTVEWVRSGYDLRVLRQKASEKLISVERLLEAVAGVQYRARSLEQVRGGEDVLRRLLPKLLAQLPAVRVTQVGRCENCDHWQPEEDPAERGLCLRCLCVKGMFGYCDEFQRREVRDGDRLEDSGDQ